MFNEQQKLQDVDKLQLNLDDILPDEEALVKLKFIIQNQESLIEDDTDNEENKQKLSDFHDMCERVGIDGNTLLEALVLTRLFYLAQTEINLTVGGENE